MRTPSKYAGVFVFSIFVLLNFRLEAQVAAAAGSGCRAGYLRCEYLEDPLGIDVVHPRLSWRLEDGRDGAGQSAYAVVVGMDSMGVVRGQGVYSSGKLLTGAQLITYAGPALKPFTRYYWKVDVWDKEGKKSESARVASFETGMMEMKNWRGAWISDSRNIHTKAAPYFRKAFTAVRKIRSARAYIATAGLYELYINGHKIGDHRLDPMYTRLDRRNLYVTYDITDELRSGDNAIGVLLGNGWYNMQSTAVWYFHEAPWRGRPCFCLDIRITYEDGSTETVSSGRDWKTSLSPIIFNSIYTGEHVDHRREQAGWDSPAFNDSAWKEVVYRSAPSGQVVAQVMPPIRDVEEIHAVSMKRIDDTRSEERRVGKECSS